MLVIKKIINKNDGIVCMFEGDEELRDYMKALKIIDELRGLDENRELLNEEKIGKIKKRWIFYRYKS